MICRQGARIPKTLVLSKSKAKKYHRNSVRHACAKHATSEMGFANEKLDAQHQEARKTNGTLCRTCQNAIEGPGKLSQLAWTAEPTVLRSRMKSGKRFERTAKLEGKLQDTSAITYSNCTTRQCHCEQPELEQRGETNPSWHSSHSRTFAEPGRPSRCPTKAPRSRQMEHIRTPALLQC
jgi:hypothetical protein